MSASRSSCTVMSIRLVRPSLLAVTTNQNAQSATKDSCKRLAESDRMAESGKQPELNKTAAQRKSARCKNNGTLMNSRYFLRKTVYFKSTKKGNKNIFVNNKTHFKGQLHRCEKLFENGMSELIIHGLGASVYKATNLALRLREIHHGCLDLDIKTSTVALEDKLVSLDSDADDEINNRNNSAIHIPLKLDDNYFLGPSGWWAVFSPLFVADGLNTYFCAIIFIRMHMEGMIKVAILRALWSLISLLLIFVFKYLLCKKLSGQSSLEYSEVLSPVFILLQLIAVRACQLH